MRPKLIFFFFQTNTAFNKKYKFKVLYTFILFLGGCVIFYDQYLNFKVFKMGTFLFLDM